MILSDELLQLTWAAWKIDDPLLYFIFYKCDTEQVEPVGPGCLCERCGFGLEVRFLGYVDQDFISANEADTRAESWSGDD